MKNIDRLTMVQDIIKHGKNIKVNMETLILLLASQTDDEVRKFHDNFLKSK